MTCVVTACLIISWKWLWEHRRDFKPDCNPCFMFVPLKLPESLFWVWEQNSWQPIVVTHTCDANSGGGESRVILNLRLVRIAQWGPFSDKQNPNRLLLRKSCHLPGSLYKWWKEQGGDAHGMVGQLPVCQEDIVLCISITGSSSRGPPVS